MKRTARKSQWTGRPELRDFIDNHEGTELEPLRPHFNFFPHGFHDRGRGSFRPDFRGRGQERTCWPNKRSGTSFRNIDPEMENRDGMYNERNFNSSGFSRTRQHEHVRKHRGSPYAREKLGSRGNYDSNKYKSTPRHLGDRTDNAYKAYRERSASYEKDRERRDSSKGYKERNRSRDSRERKYRKRSHSHDRSHKRNWERSRSRESSHTHSRRSGSRDSRRSRSSEMQNKNKIDLSRKENQIKEKPKETGSETNNCQQENSTVKASEHELNIVKTENALYKEKSESVMKEEQIDFDVSNKSQDENDSNKTQGGNDTLVAQHENDTLNSERPGENIDDEILSMSSTEMRSDGTSPYTSGERSEDTSLEIGESHFSRYEKKKKEIPSLKETAKAENEVCKKECKNIADIDLKVNEIEEKKSVKMSKENFDNSIADKTFVDKITKQSKAIEIYAENPVELCDNDIKVNEIEEKKSVKMSKENFDNSIADKTLVDKITKQSKAIEIYAGNPVELCKAETLSIATKTQNSAVISDQNVKLMECDVVGQILKDENYSIMHKMKSKMIQKDVTPQKYNEEKVTTKYTEPKKNKSKADDLSGPDRTQYQSPGSGKLTGSSGKHPVHKNYKTTEQTAFDKRNKHSAKLSKVAGKLPNACNASVGYPVNEGNETHLRIDTDQHEPDAYLSKAEGKKSRARFESVVSSDNERDEKLKHLRTHYDDYKQDAKVSRANGKKPNDSIESVVSYGNETNEKPRILRRDSDHCKHDAQSCKAGGKRHSVSIESLLPAGNERNEKTKQVRTDSEHRSSLTDHEIPIKENLNKQSGKNMPTDRHSINGSCVNQDSCFDIVGQILKEGEHCMPIKGLERSVSQDTSTMKTNEISSSKKIMPFNSAILTSTPSKTETKVYNSKLDKGITVKKMEKALNETYKDKRKIENRRSSGPSDENSDIVKKRQDADEMVSNAEEPSFHKVCLDKSQTVSQRVERYESLRKDVEKEAVSNNKMPQTSVSKHIDIPEKSKSDHNIKEKNKTINKNIHSTTYTASDKNQTRANIFEHFENHLDQVNDKDKLLDFTRKSAHKTTVSENKPERDRQVTLSKNEVECTNNPEVRPSEVSPTDRVCERQKSSDQNTNCDKSALSQNDDQKCKDYSKFLIAETEQSNSMKQKENVSLKTCQNQMKNISGASHSNLPQILSSVKSINKTIPSQHEQIVLDLIETKGLAQENVSAASVDDNQKCVKRTLLEETCLNQDCLMSNDNFISEDKTRKRELDAESVSYCNSKISAMSVNIHAFNTVAEGYMEDQLGSAKDLHTKDAIREDEITKKLDNQGSKSNNLDGSGRDKALENTDDRSKTNKMVNLCEKTKSNFSIENNEGNTDKTYKLPSVINDEELDEDDFCFIDINPYSPHTKPGPDDKDKAIYSDISDEDSEVTNIARSSSVSFKYCDDRVFIEPLEKNLDKYSGDVLSNELLANMNNIETCSKKEGNETAANTSDYIGNSEKSNVDKKLMSKRKNSLLESDLDEIQRKKSKNDDEKMLDEVEEKSDTVPYTPVKCESLQNVAVNKVEEKSDTAPYTPVKCESLQNVAVNKQLNFITQSSKTPKKNYAKRLEDASKGFDEPVSSEVRTIDCEKEPNQHGGKNTCNKSGKLKRKLSKEQLKVQLEELKSQSPTKKTKIESSKHDESPPYRRNKMKKDLETVKKTIKIPVQSDKSGSICSQIPKEQTNNSEDTIDDSRENESDDILDKPPVQLRSGSDESTAPVLKNGFDITHTITLKDLRLVTTTGRLDPQRMESGDRCIMCEICTSYFSPLEFTNHHDSGNIILNIDREKSIENSFQPKNPNITFWNEDAKNIWDKFEELFQKEKKQKLEGDAAWQSKSEKDIKKERSKHSKISTNTSAKNSNHEAQDNNKEKPESTIVSHIRTSTTDNVNRENIMKDKIMGVTSHIMKTRRHSGNSSMGQIPNSNQSRQLREIQPKPAQSQPTVVISTTDAFQQSAVSIPQKLATVQSNAVMTSGYMTALNMHPPNQQSHMVIQNDSFEHVAVCKTPMASAPLTVVPKAVSNIILQETNKVTSAIPMPRPKEKVLETNQVTNRNLLENGLAVSRTNLEIGGINPVLDGSSSKQAAYNNNIAPVAGTVVTVVTTGTDRRNLSNSSQYSSCSSKESAAVSTQTIAAHNFVNARPSKAPSTILDASLLSEDELLCALWKKFNLNTGDNDFNNLLLGDRLGLRSGYRLTQRRSQAITERDHEISEARRINTSLKKQREWIEEKLRQNSELEKKVEENIKTGKLNF